ncbi:PAS domain-containing protein [Chryseolinea lacunae]|uniref:histidine kinase n=1 Tax=Chryseolinea lacunae TaxID=2801331 RepID=A0ABS1KU15_9BACT|nr:PAS domain-containing protein [Chryseolinea lacunae]MBL0742737.1 PAS domain-containing protein [Chryseolinea lacunae]
MELNKDLVYDKLFKVAPVCIDIVDLQTRQLVQTSAWVVNHIGYTEEEFIALSKNLFEGIVHKDDRQTQLQTYESLMNNPTDLFKECVIRFRKKDGDYLHVQIRLSVLEVDETNKPKSSLNTITDISELIDLRHRLNAELRKMDIISFKNSHELRGPVATILGLIQLIDHDGLHGEFSMNIIDALRQTVKKLDEVIGEINRHSNV